MILIRVDIESDIYTQPDITLYVTNTSTVDEISNLIADKIATVDEDLYDSIYLEVVEINKCGDIIKLVTDSIDISLKFDSSVVTKRLLKIYASL